MTHISIKIKKQNGADTWECGAGMGNLRTKDFSPVASATSPTSPKTRPLGRFIFGLVKGFGRSRFFGINFPCHPILDRGNPSFREDSQFRKLITSELPTPQRAERHFHHSIHLGKREDFLPGRKFLSTAFHLMPPVCVLYQNPNYSN